MVVTDWDISGTWNLDTSTYISGPCSFFINSPYGATCKKSEVWNVTNGMLVTYAKAAYDWGAASSDHGLFFGFRNQATSGAGISGSGYVTAGYTLVLAVRSPAVGYYRDTVSIGGKTLTAKPAHANEWNKYRVTWWTNLGGSGLLIRLEYWDGAKWVKMVSDLYDSTDKYKDSTVNRVSIGSPVNYYAWFDDTEIWGG